MIWKKNYKLIAEFMGLNVVTISDLRNILRGRKENKLISTPQFVTVDELKYSISWDWLMPVVNKINDICIRNDDDRFVECEYYDSVLDTIPLANIEDSYQAVINFIEYYNKVNILRTYKWSLSGENVWSNFDNGEVTAYTLADAKEKQLLNLHIT